MPILKDIAFGISMVGIVVIFWGALLIIFEFLLAEYHMLRKHHEITKDKNDVRRHLGAYILLGLEFTIAGDIIHTVAKPDYEGLIVLGAIVVIRTVISFFLNKELKGN